MQMDCLSGFGRVLVESRAACHPSDGPFLGGFSGRSEAAPEVGPARLWSAVRPPARRQAATLAWSPDGQDLRDRPALEHLRAGVLRVFQQPVGEALLVRRDRLAHDAWKQPDAGVEQHQRRDLAARQHVIADRDLLRGRGLRSRARPRPRTAPHRIDRAGRRAPAPRPAAWVSGRPRGLISRRGRGHPPAPRRSRAPAHRPSSPCPGRRRPACRRPCGACRCRIRGCRWSSSDQVPAASALPARLTPSGPGNMSGKMVSTHGARQVMVRLRPFGRCEPMHSQSPPAIRYDDLAHRRCRSPARGRPRRTAASWWFARPVRPAVRQCRRAPKSVHRDHRRRTPRPPALTARKPDQVGVIELAIVRRAAARRVDIELDVASTPRLPRGP